MEKPLDRSVYLSLCSIPRYHVPQPLYYFPRKSLQAITASDSLRLLSQDLEDSHQSTIFIIPPAYLLTFIRTFRLLFTRAPFLNPLEDSPRLTTLEKSAYPSFFNFF